MGVVSGGGKADGHAARLMVGGDDDQRLFRMLGGEVDGHLHGVGEGDGVHDAGLGVVGVAAPVDLAALSHEEEAFFVVVQRGDASLDHVGQGHALFAFSGATDAVDLVQHRGILGDGGVDGQRAAALAAQRGVFISGIHHGEAVFLGQREQVVLRAVLAVRLEERAAAQEVQRRAGHALQGDVVVLVAALGFGVVGRGSGVVKRHAGDDADLLAGFLGILGDEFEGLGQVNVVVQDAGKGLVAGRHGSGGGSGIRAEGGSVVGSHQADVLKAGEGERRGNGQLGIGILQRAQVVLGGGHLGVAHAVADEHEHVLRRSGSGFLSHRGHGAHEQRQRQKGSKQSLHFVHLFFHLGPGRG